MDVSSESSQERLIHHQVIVDHELSGQRIDKALALQFNRFSRSQIGKWIKDGAVTVDGKVIKANTRAKLGETIVVSARLPKLLDWDSAEDIQFEVVFEDDAVIVIDKPAGLVVHPGAGNPDSTLVNGLLRMRPTLRNLPRAGIVHRLDKDTSGLLVVAAQELARQRLSEQIAARSVRRHYLCVVEGCLDYPKRVELPIRRSQKDRTKQQVSRTGREAITDFIPIEKFRAHTLVQARLHTGRTHQIRVHASAIGLPLVGDKRYGAKNRLPAFARQEIVDVISKFKRQALHAANLEFAHPLTDERLNFSSQLPSDLETLISALRTDLGD